MNGPQHFRQAEPRDFAVQLLQCAGSEDHAHRGQVAHERLNHFAALEKMQGSNRTAGAPKLRYAVRWKIVQYVYTR